MEKIRKEPPGSSVDYQIVMISPKFKAPTPALTALIKKATWKYMGELLPYICKN